LHEAKGHIGGFFDDPYGKYWALYDISWSIVAGFIQCQATGADVGAHNFVGLATAVANDAMAKACNVKDAETCALLLDLIEVLHPVLVTDEETEKPWEASYNRALVTKPLYRSE
jgi:hypothetical protein